MILDLQEVARENRLAYNDSNFFVFDFNFNLGYINMKYFYMGFGMAICLAAVTELTGCAKPENMIRVSEYAAETRYVGDSTVGGCTLESTENVPLGKVVYAGDKCTITVEGSK